ncbi:TPA: LysR family transcriptional regulator [Escherichia coli]|nr:LysR family transcriptional regulator [Escherichia coli]
MKKSITTLDLNLLLCLQLLMQERSVTKAAKRMNVTPSAVSKSLAKLRAWFDDPLFVYMSKKTAGGRNTARYLGRYLKKPPIAASRLAHYNGGASLSFRYLDHKTGETATETLTQRELVARLKQHIPEKFFKMVRYFGFLANRVCGEKLPQVYRALGMDKPEPVAKVCYAQMVKQFLSRDPFECVLCGCRMVYRRAIAGLNVSGLKKNARDISLLRYMPA